ETFRVLEICRRAFPDMILCLGSNGLLLAKNAERLRDLGVSTVTVTVNSLDPDVLTRLVPRICLSKSAGEEKVWAEGTEAARLLIDRQLEGIRLCASLGMTVKVNTVLVPGINDGGVEDIAMKAAELGASVQNIMPLIPAGRLSGLKAPDRGYVRALQDRLDPVIRQFRSCARCRADACGLLSEGAGQSGCIK
ncbi:MAG: radical SAM protein, partial [Firmicutes bacterium]|nr:radical SAM protein [Bacillota bacterium]